MQSGKVISDSASPRITLEVPSDIGQYHQQVDPGSMPGMTRFFRYRHLPFVIPAQAGIHPARITFEVLSDIGRQCQPKSLYPGLFRNWCDDRAEYSFATNFFDEGRCYAYG